jgi:hypothetical protein
MTIDEAIKKLLSEAEQQDKWADNYVRMDYYSEATPPEVSRQHAKECRQLAEWLTDYKELKNSIGAVKLSNMKEALELIRAYKAENAALREFNDKIYDLLSDTFGCPCNFSPIDEYMMENGGCDDCNGAISNEECWRRYIQTKLLGGETDEHS